MTGTAQLHAVRYPDQVTAADALAWFAARPAAAAGSREVIGYLLAPDRAEWFRCEGAVPHGPDGARDLAGAFEVCATDGAVQLRWVHQTSGHGRAVSLAEDSAALPPGQAIPASPERRRLEGTPERVLAGRVAAARDGWAALVTARYAPCDVPVTAATGQEVWAELAEYAVCDEHGNLSVADTLLLRLLARAPAPAAKENQP